MGLEGTWRNERGSVLVIKEVTNGTLVGSYKTAVGKAGCAKGEFPVTGRTDVGSGGNTVGFAVTWKNDQSDCDSSTTVWAAQYLDNDGHESLTSVWLLVSKTEPKEQWASTLVGDDIFTRTANPEQLKEAAARKPQPHP